MLTLKIPALFYAVVVVVIMLPLLTPGFILSLDMVFTPFMPPPTAASNTFLYEWLVHAASTVLPADMLQKLILASILFVSGLGAHLALRLSAPGLWTGSYYFAGLLYACNPFVYSHFMAGQFLLLAGYAGLAVFIAAMLWFLRQPTPWRAVTVAGSAIAISLVSLHAAGIAALAGFIIIGYMAWSHRHDRLWLRRTARLGGAVAVGVVVCSSYWLWPLIAGHGPTATVLQGFDKADHAAFALATDGFGALGNVLALQGFWGDRAELYILPSDSHNWWWLPYIALWALVGGGMAVAWRLHRGMGIAFGVIGLVGVLLAISPLLQLLATNVSFFAGYRDSQKFVMLLVVCYAFFAALGLHGLYRWLCAKQAGWAAYAVVWLPILIAPLMLGGFNGQLTPRSYPSSWFALREYLQTNSGNGKVLFLPWHLYMDFDFANRIIAHPAPQFFTVPVVISDDPELNGANSYNSGELQTNIAHHILPAAAQGHDIARKLAAHNIVFVVLLKEYDYRQYTFISQQPAFTKINETAEFTLYKVNR